MANQFEVSIETLDWLVVAVESDTSYATMAAKVGCCTDTLKRILHRNGIVEFEGAKYAKKTLLYQYHTGRQHPATNRSD